MIITFVLLGLGFVCGGAAAIVDGLPYVVLERGFTQVIIGTVVSVAGIMMLALSWVLVELRRLGRKLSANALATSLASIAAGPTPDHPVASPRPAVEPESLVAGARPGLVVAGAGALAGAGVALAATQGAASGAPGEPEDRESEPDLFGLRPADERDPAAGVQTDDVDADRDAHPASEPPVTVDPQSEPQTLHATEIEPDDQPLLRPAFAIEPDAASPEAQDAPEPMISADDWRDGRIAEPEAAEIDRALPSEGPAASAPSADEFGLLRDSLAGLGLGPEPVGHRTEPSFADSREPRDRAEDPDDRRPDAVTEAASWMEPAFQRRAPWFEPSEPETPSLVSPSALAGSTTEPDIAWPTAEAPDRDAPPWPPQAREATTFEPDLPGSETPDHDRPGDNAIEREDSASITPEVETPGRAEPDAAAPDAVAEDDTPPAASDEGIVGAYQVGEAHFTIYADGSIQARTPDGDYSFNSMDELKIYLASEKSRLGV